MLTSNEDIATGRVIDPDGSVRPARDTGFRMETTPKFEYLRRADVTDNRPFIDFLHWDDMTDVGQGTLRGQKLDSVRVYKIDYAKVEARVLGYILENIAKTNG